MGATSVTGVGVGSAESMNKGAAGRMTLGVGHLIGPHVVAASRATLSSGAATVHFPLLPGVATDYVVLVTDSTGAAACSGSLAFSTDSVLTLAGTGSHVLAWAVVKIGF